MRIAFWLLVTVTVMLVLTVLACVETVPPGDLTRTRMTVIEKRIRDYAAAHHRLPDNLSQLPKPAGNRDDSIVDGWGHPIQYIKVGNKVTLLSLGKDGSAGGSDQDAGIKVTFTISD
jgi:hypothetical protein